MATRQRGTTWQADLQHAGKRYRETFGTEAEAVSWDTKAREALKAGKPLPNAAQQAGGAYATMQKLLDVVVATDWGRKRGCQGQISHAQKFVDYVGGHTPPATALTQERVDGFITDALLPRKLSGSTVNRYLSSVSKMATKALTAGIIPRALVMPWGKEGEARIRWFSDEEEALIKQTLRLWSLPDWLDFFTVLVDTGGRPWTEVTGVAWEDVSRVPRMVTFRKTKNGEHRPVPLTESACAAIERQRGHEEGPFCRMDPEAGQRLYERLRAHLPSLEGTMWYTARHTFASRLVQRGVDLYRVQKLMGHKNPLQTQRYAKLAPVHLIDAIAVLEPKRPKLEVVV